MWDLNLTKMTDTRKKILVLTAAGFSQAYLRYDNKKLSSANINEVLINGELFVKYYSEIYSHEPTESILKIQEMDLIYLFCLDGCIL